LIERLGESAIEMIYWKEDERTSFLALGRFLGELGEQLFAVKEQKRKGYKGVQKHTAQPVMPVAVLPEV
jgi:hypothetical protein